MLTRDSIPRPRPAVRRALAIIGILVVLGIPALRWLATFWTDYLWYDSVSLTGVWSTVVFTRVGLVLVTSALAFAVLWLNLWLADRLSRRAACSRWMRASSQRPCSRPRWARSGFSKTPGTATSRSR